MLSGDPHAEHGEYRNDLLSDLMTLLPALHTLVVKGYRWDTERRPFEPEQQLVVPSRMRVIKLRVPGRFLLRIRFARVAHTPAGVARALQCPLLGRQNRRRRWSGSPAGSPC